MNTVSGVQ